MFDNNIIARITKDGREQTLQEHSRNVSNYAKMFGEKCGIGEIVRIAGFWHDIGKATPEWQEYLKRNDPQEKLSHSIFGAKNAYNETISFPCIAEMLSNIIAAHHGRLYDNIAPDGSTPINDKLSENTGVAPHCTLNIDMNVLKNEFISAINVGENSDKPFFLSMLTKLAFSCLIDADRLDAYLAETDKSHTSPTVPDWEQFISKLDSRLFELSKKRTPMTELRDKVSEGCKVAGLRDIGIYKLEVPTGGGKTLSSLRFALEHARSID
jgi:CRISPR-associated endonuclease/helicase Cas3